MVPAVEILMNKLQHIWCVVGDPSGGIIYSAEIRRQKYAVHTDSTQKNCDVRLVEKKLN